MRAALESSAGVLAGANSSGVECSICGSSGVKSRSVVDAGGSGVQAVSPDLEGWSLSGPFLRAPVFLMIFSGSSVCNACRAMSDVCWLLLTLNLAEARIT